MNTFTNLLYDLVNYSARDAPFTGNPQITYCVEKIKKNNFQRCTNISSGVVKFDHHKISIANNIQTHSYALNRVTVQAEVVTKFIISFDQTTNPNNTTNSDNTTNSNQTDSFTNLKEIILKYQGEEVVISNSDLKILDQIRNPNDKIVFKTNNKYIISLNLIDFFTRSNTTLSEYDFIGLPKFNMDDLMIDVCFFVNTNNTNNNIINIDAKIQYICLDTEEKRKSYASNIYRNYKLQQFKLNNESVSTDIINIPTNLTNANTTNNTITYKLTNKILTDNEYFCVETNNFDAIDSIDIYFNDNKIVLTKNVISLYDELYDKIISRDESTHNKTYIKLKGTMYRQNYTNPTDILVKINYVQVNSTNFITNPITNLYLVKTSQKYSQTESEQKMFMSTDDFQSYFKEFVFDVNLNSVKQTHIINNEIFHMKEMIICYKIGSEYVRLANKFNIGIDICGDANTKNTVLNSYTSDDCDMYQQLYHKKFIENLYTIPYSLDMVSYPINEFSVNNSITIDSELDLSTVNKEIKMHVKMHVFVFGYKVINKEYQKQRTNFDLEQEAQKYIQDTIHLTK